MPLRKAVLSLAVLLFAAAPLVLAQGTCSQIDYPGATSTYALGINAAGDVVGGYYDAIATPHGFLLSGGVYTTIDDPDIAGAFAFGINDVGQIVGNTSYVSGVPTAGYLYDLNTQTFASIAFPKSGALTIPRQINNAGVIVGTVDVPHRTGTDVYGFELNDGRYRLLIYPPGSTDTQLNGINNLGQAVGLQFTGSVSNNFYYIDGRIKPIRVHARDASVASVNDSGVIAGDYYPEGEGVHGFILQNNNFQEISCPEFTDNVASGINESGVVVGWFSSASNHGFTWTPPADAAKK
jgi:uncharacterized membrane protein